MNILRKFFQNKKNYYSLVLALLIGFFLIFINETLFDNKSLVISQNSDAYSISNSNTINNNTQSELSYESMLEEKLEETLSLVEGVGKVKVMITLENSKEIVTKDDTYIESSITTEESTSGDKREILSEKQETSTVKINEDEPLILKEISPKVSGVIIVAQGGGNIEVKNNLINATKALLNLEIHKIEVLKMK